MNKYSYNIAKSELTAAGTVTLTDAAAVIFINRGNQTVEIDYNESGNLIQLLENESISFEAPEGTFGANADITFNAGSGDTPKLEIVKTTRTSLLAE